MSQSLGSLVLSYWLETSATGGVPPNFLVSNL